MARESLRALKLLERADAIGDELRLISHTATRRAPDDEMAPLERLEQTCARPNGLDLLNYRRQQLLLKPVLGE